MTDINTLNERIRCCKKQAEAEQRGIKKENVRIYGEITKNLTSGMGAQDVLDVVRKAIG